MWRRLTHGAGAVLMVGALSFSVVVVNSGPAQAAGEAEWLQLVPVAAAGGGVGIGGSATLAAATCAGTAGIGCAVIGGAIIGAALWSTKDVTVPFYKNLFGIGSDAPPPGVPTFGTGDSACGWVAATVASFVSCEATRMNITKYTDPEGLERWAWSLRGNTNWGNGANTGGTNYGVMGYFHTDVGWLARPTAGTYPDGVEFRRIKAAPAGQPNFVLAGSIMLAPVAATVENPWPGNAGVPDANMAIQTTVKCINPDGTKFSVIGASTLGNLGKALIPTCAGAPGSMDGAHGECYDVAAGAIGGLLMDQSSNCLGAATNDALYPNCVGVGGAHCTYTVKLDGVRCVVGGSCANWSKLYAEDPSRIQCNFGSYVVPVAQCGMLERLYEASPTGKPWDATQQNTDGDPNTWSKPGPNGEPADNPAINPLSPPAVAPLPLAVPEPPPVTTAETECFPTGWGIVINPTDWVLMPVKCALAWAFVPKAANLNTEPIRAELTRAGIQPSVTALTGVVGTLGGVASGCTGPHIVFDIKPSATMPAIKADMTPFAACVDPMKSIAGYTYALISLGVIVSGSLRVVTLIAAGFGYAWTIEGGGLVTTKSYGMG